MKRRALKITGWLVVVIVIVGLGIGLWQARQEAAALRGEGEAVSAALRVLDREKASLRVPHQDALPAPPPPSGAPVGMSKYQSWREALAHIRSNRPSPPLPPPAATPWGKHGEMFPELLGDPEYNRLVGLYQRANIEGQYAHYFATSTAPPATLEKLKAVLVQWKYAELERAELVAQNRVPPSQSGELSFLLQEKREAELRALLGAAEYAAFRRSEETRNQRRMVDGFAERASYAAEPLTRQQAEELVVIVASEQEFQTYGAQKQRTRMVPVRKFNEAVLARARPVLTPAQWEQLRLFQAERDAAGMQW